jgi:ABC-2 type transport system ATP-binding protein
MRWMRGLLRGFADRGGTVLLSSHLLAEVEAVADRMMIIGGGRIQAQGTHAELLSASGTIVEADDVATLDAVLDCAGLRTHPAAGGSSRPSPRSSRAWRWPTPSCCAGSPQPTAQASNASSSS